MTDEMSKNPELLAEARRVQAQSGLPTPEYDARKILREVYDRIVDSRYALETFDSFIERLSKTVDDESQARPGAAIVGFLTEAEYRRFVEAIVRDYNAMMLMAFASGERKRSTTMREAVLYEMYDRIPAAKNGTALIDPAVGRIWNLGKSQKQSCALHPDGCPDDGPEITAIPVSGTAAAELLGEILKRVKR